MWRRVACIFAGTIEELVIFRFFQAVGGCAGPVLGRAVVRDVWGPEKSATVLAYMGTAMALAPAVAPVLGASFMPGSGGGDVRRACRLQRAVPAPRLPDGGQPHNPDATAFGGWGNYVDLLSHRSYIGYVLMIASYSVIFCFISGSSFVLIDIVGLSPDEYGLCFGTMVLGYMAGTAISGRVGQRVGLDRMVLIGGLSRRGRDRHGGLRLGRHGQRVSIVGPQVVAMLGVGFIFLNAQAGAIVLPDEGRGGVGALGLLPDGYRGGGRHRHRPRFRRHRPPRGHRRGDRRHAGTGVLHNAGSAGEAQGRRGVAAAAE